MTRTRILPTLRSNKGFSLIEMVITVAVLAILVGITTPSIYEFIRMRDKQNEEIAQMQVRKALEAYIADVGEAPSDTSTSPFWYEALAGYTSLSQNEIANDVWDNPRTYIMYRDANRGIYGVSVTVSYVTLHSMGPDGQADNQEDQNGTTVTVNGVALTSAAGGSVFNGSTAADWWKNKSDPAQAFADVRGADDDVMMRYTNYDDVRIRYQTTSERIRAVGDALETFARTQYAAHISECIAVTTSTTKCTGNGNPNSGIPVAAIYYPRSIPISGSSDTARYYYSEYVPATNFVPSTAATVNNTSTDANRREDMIDLMRMLGLPADYCCSALELGTDSKPKPFYYFSNPRVRLASGCSSSRPTGSEPKLPARITTGNFADSSSNRTCG